MTGQAAAASRHYRRTIDLAPHRPEAARAQALLSLGNLPEEPPGAGGRDHHATPAGWKPTWPTGDAARGRQIFVKLECFACHKVESENLPEPSDPTKVGPELSQMGPLHDAIYFVEAIVNPSATIDRGKGYEASDGSSTMPSFNDVLTVQELVDLVAFLKALRPPAGAAGRGEHPSGPPAGHGKH